MVFSTIISVIPAPACPPLEGAGIQKKMKEDKKYYVYILASAKNGTLYIGVTSRIIKRINEHKEKLIEGFTKKHNIDQLVWYEAYGEVG